MLADGEAAVHAACDDAGGGEVERVAAPGRAADLARLGLPDRVVLVLAADQRMGDLVQQAVLDRLGRSHGGEAGGHRDQSAAGVAGGATALGMVEAERPAGQPVPAQERQRQRLHLAQLAARL